MILAQLREFPALVLVSLTFSIVALAQSKDLPLNVNGSPERSHVLQTAPLTTTPQTTLWKTPKLFVFRQQALVSAVMDSGPRRMLIDMPTLQWFSQPIISGGMIVFVFQASANAYLYALDVQTGNQIMVLKFADMRLSPPAVRGSKIFFSDDTGVVRAVDAATRKEVWSVESKEGAAITLSPLVDDEFVYVHFAGVGLHALELETGNVKWIFKTTSDIKQIAANNERLAVINARAALLSVDRKTGTKQWEASVERDAASPVLMGDQVFVRFDSGEVRAYSVKDGSLIWQGKPAGGAGTLIAASRQLIFYGGRERNLVAVDAATGQEKWVFKTNNRCTNPIVVADFVYANCEDKKFYAIDLTTGLEKWRLDTRTNMLTWSTFADGVLYRLGSDGILTAMK